MLFYCSKQWTIVLPIVLSKNMTLSMLIGVRYARCIALFLFLIFYFYSFLSSIFILLLSIVIVMIILVSFCQNQKTIIIQFNAASVFRCSDAPAAPLFFALLLGKWKIYIETLTV